MTPTPQPAELAKRVRLAREALGLSQIEVALAAKVSRATLQQIEQGLRFDGGPVRPRAVNVRNLARVLQLNEDELLVLAGRTDEKGTAGLAGRPTVSQRAFAEKVNRLPEHLRNAVVTIAEALDAQSTSVDESTTPVKSLDGAA